MVPNIHINIQLIQLAPDDEYPHTLDNMMDKKVLFKLNVKAANVKQYDPVYTVMKVCDDEDTISKNLPMTLVDNNTHVVNVRKHQTL